VNADLFFLAVLKGVLLGDSVVKTRLEKSANRSNTRHSDASYSLQIQHDIRIMGTLIGHSSGRKKVICNPCKGSEMIEV